MLYYNFEQIQRSHTFSHIVVIPAETYKIANFINIIYGKMIQIKTL